MRALARTGRDTSHVHRRWSLPLLFLAGLFLAGCATDDPQSVLNPAGRVAREQDALWNLVFPIAVGVFVFVEITLLWVIFKYRAKGSSDVPKQVAGNTKLEIVWTLIPAVILAGIAVPTVQTIFELAEPPDDNALEVRVIGKQYWWEFEYLNDEGQSVVTATDLHIPTDRPVYLQMQSVSAILPDPGADEIDVTVGQINAGVIHSFWVPRLAGKQDVIPQHIRFLTIEADEPGVYEGQCAEFCGLSHARMRMNVVAREPAEFEEWLAEQAEPAQPADTELAQLGQALFASQQCIACHAINGYAGPGGVTADTRIGPNLTHFASRLEMAGGIMDITTENIQAWLENPQAIKPGAQMPDLGLSEPDIDALTAYLQSLE